MNIWSKDLESYLENHSESEEEVLKELNRETYLKALKPHMISGHVQGLFLEMISQLTQPKQVLEIGTYTGYSAICLAKGLQENGRLHTIDNNTELKEIAQKYWKKAGIDKKITLHQGNALEIIPKLEITFDMVFIDADKENYPNYYEMLLPKVRKGGVILIDNVLWKGKVLKNEKEQDKITQTLHHFNKRLKDDKRIKKVILSIRDGLTFVYKR